MAAGCQCSNMAAHSWRQKAQPKSCAPATRPLPASCQPPTPSQQSNICSMTPSLLPVPSHYHAPRSLDSSTPMKPRSSGLWNTHLGRVL